ncbi:hypothetical protein OH77DRAFT_804198 [Trametes cingulata]|nr:hypothetical protein OH77DRAFT_804198 [Trametes cingulata]
MGSRLPSYRHSHGSRYHPYPRPLRRRELVGMIAATDGVRVPDEPSLGEEYCAGLLTTHTAAREATSHVDEGSLSDEDVANLERALHPEGDVQGRGLSTLVVELAFAVRRALYLPVTVIMKHVYVGRYSAATQ